MAGWPVVYGVIGGDLDSFIRITPSLPSPLTTPPPRGNMWSRADRPYSLNRRSRHRPKGSPLRFNFDLCESRLHRASGFYYPLGSDIAPDSLPPSARRRSPRPVPNGKGPRLPACPEPPMANLDGGRRTSNLPAWAGLPRNHRSRANWFQASTSHKPFIICSYAKSCQQALYHLQLCFHWT
jgi:hypothetical protein